jgi:hypothetical protein
MNNETKWGVIDMAGVLIQDFIYEDISSSDEKIIVKSNNKWYYFSLSDKKMKKVSRRKMKIETE